MLVTEAEVKTRGVADVVGRAVACFGNWVDGGVQFRAALGRQWTMGETGCSSAAPDVWSSSAHHLWTSRDCLRESWAWAFLETYEVVFLAAAYERTPAVGNGSGFATADGPDAVERACCFEHSCPLPCCHSCLATYRQGGERLD